MLDIYLTDTQKQVLFNDYPGDHPVKFILNFKKIFPSIMETLLPVLPEDNDLGNITWESTEKNFEIFKLFLSSWGVVELRLNAITKFKERAYADQLVKKSQKMKAEKKSFSAIETDYLFLQYLHGLIDAELVEVGESFYLPKLRTLWKPYISEKFLNGKV